MGKRQTILLGIGAGAVWSIGLLWVGVAWVELPIFSLLPGLAFAFLPPGLVLLAMVGRLAAGRFLDDRIIDGQPFVPGSPRDIDQRVLANTVEQTVLALCLWPPCAYLLTVDGPGVAVTLGVGFAVSRLAFWVGYHRAPALRGFGFAATFYATVGVVLLALVRSVAGLG